MTTMFTVRMERLKITSVFDAAGNKVGDKVERIPQVYADLPYVTAHGFVLACPDANVSIEQQKPSVESGRSTYRETATRTRPEHTERPRASKPKTPAVNSTVEAATSGDMSSAVYVEKDN